MNDEAPAEDMPAIHGSRLVLTVSSILISAFSMGWHIGVMNNAKEAAATSLGLDNSAWGSIVGAFCLGALPGGLLGGNAADRAGRRGTLASTNAPLLVGVILQATAESFWGLLLGRIFVGFGVGIATAVVPSYLAEIAPVESRGAIGASNQLVICVGIFASQIAAVYMAQSWRLLFALPIGWTALQLLLIHLVPDSPRFLAQIRDREKLRDALLFLRGGSNVEAEVGRILDSQEDKSDQTMSGTLLLRTPSMRKALFMGTFLLVTQQFSGINAVFFYSSELFLQAFGSSHTAYILSALLSFFNILATLVSVFLVDRYGRRPLLLASQAGMAVCCLMVVNAMARGASAALVATFILYILFFAIGLGPVPWLLLGELFPPSTAGVASSVAVSGGWLANYMVSICFLPMADVLGDKVFLPFAVFLTIAAVMTFSFLEETKVKTFEDTLRAQVP